MPWSFLLIQLFEDYYSLKEFAAVIFDFTQFFQY